ncbi:MAG: hypothetical protein LBL16_02170 [Endomicrobium sp.]|jgi:hypothetical protein|nr:hypothetical protein [Endomicrobium sp.]
MNSGYLKGLNVATGINFIYNKDTWYMRNIDNHVDTKAGNVDLSDVSYTSPGYFEYGIGGALRKLQIGCL